MSPGKMRENHFIWLTLSLVGILIAGALTDEFPNVFVLRIVEYGNVALLLLALQSLRGHRKAGRVLLGLVVSLLIIVILRGITELTQLGILYLLALLAFLLTAISLVSREVLLTGSVDINKIIGSIALYLLIGLSWAIFYTLLLEFFPHALHGIEAEDWTERLPDATYFSFVTLTTLGYGEIHPVTPLSRVLVMLEAVTGMFYLALIVASLIGSLRDNK